jgi:hypothetical protein
MRLFYNRSNSQLIEYANAFYFSNPHKERSQTDYLFTYRGTVISWRSVKQTLVATSSNHSEIIAIHEANQKYIWLRLIIQNIKKNMDCQSLKIAP